MQITNKAALISPAAARQTPIITSQLWIALIALLLLPLVSCGRSKARHRLAQDKFFIEILQRENSRQLGNDKFFENCLLKNSDPKVRQWAAVALGRIASPDALPLLYKALKTGDTALRAASAFAIGEIEDRKNPERLLSVSDAEAVAELMYVLDDPAIIVRMRAVEALGKIGSHFEAAEVARRLESFHFTGAPSERAYLRASIAALEKLGDPIARPAIEKFSDSSDGDLRERALDALIRIDSKASDPPVRATGLQKSFIDPAVSSITEIFCRVLAANRKNSTIAWLETNRGEIEIELFREEAPITVENFVLMATGGDYNGTKFESVIPQRLIEGISSRTRAGHIRAIPGEVNMQSFERGSVGMGLIDTYSEPGRFFIALKPQSDLDGIHTCFGRVISGMQVADRIVPGDLIHRIVIKETISFLNHQSY